MQHLVDQNAADRAARCFGDIEYLDHGLIRAHGGDIDGEPARDRAAAVEQDQVERETRERGRPGIGDDEIGAAISALLLKLVELKANRFWRFGPCWRRPPAERERKDDGERSGRDPSQSTAMTRL